MLIQAVQKNTRQTPRKVRLVANAVKGKSLKQVVSDLAVMDRRASLVVLKVLKQAIANAQHNHSLSVDQLDLKNIIVDEGQTYRRFRAVSRGRAHTIEKKTCHITVQLETAQNAVVAKPSKAADKKEDKKAEAKEEDAKAAKSGASKSASNASKKESEKKAAAKVSKTPVAAKKIAPKTSAKSTKQTAMAKSTNKTTNK